MSKTKFLTRLTLVFIMVALLSCNKDDPKTSKTDLLSRTWMITGAKFADQDVFPSWEECVKDDLFIFTRDGSFTRDEGATKCDPGLPQTETGRWSFLDGESIIKIDFDASSEEQTILALSKTSLTITYLYDGVKFELIYTAV